MFDPTYARYRTQMSSVSTPAGGEYGMMSGCTWHTVNANGSNLHSPSNDTIAISQHLLPMSPSSNNPLSSLTQQIQMAMMMENSGIGVDGNSAMAMTEILMNTVSGINTLRAAIGENVLGEFLALLLKDGRDRTSDSRDSGQTFLPIGLLDN